MIIAGIAGLLFMFGTEVAGHAETPKLRILTSFLPMYCFAANVAGNLAEVDNLLPPGADPHDFQFTSREVKKLEAADVVVVNGLHLESWLDQVFSSVGHPRTVVEAAAGLKPELIYNTPYLDLERDGAASPLPASSAPNPHVWLDPQLAEHEVNNIADALCKADPANAAGYAQNAREYIGRLKSLDAEIGAGLAPLKGKAIVTYHDAFPYFARRYGLKIACVIERIEDVPPSPKYLAALNRAMRREGVKVIFAERQSPMKLPEQIGQDYGVAVAQLDTLETGDFKPDAYEEGMRSNLRTLEKYLK